jgi:hypothetical protein
VDRFLWHQLIGRFLTSFLAAGTPEYGTSKNPTNFSCFIFMSDDSLNSRKERQIISLSFEADKEMLVVIASSKQPSTFLIGQLGTQVSSVEQK